MESTGIYWLLLYFLFKENGFDVVSVNACDIKNLFGRKTDEADAEWIMLLHSYVLLNISDLLGKSGMAIIKAIIDGNHNPADLSMLTEANCKSPKEKIAKSLEGTWSEDHLFELKQSYDLYLFMQAQLRDCDRQIETHLIRYRAHFDIPDDEEFPRSKKKIGKKNAVGFNMEKYAFDIWGVNLMAIPGMSAISLLQLIGELGHDFVDKFDTCHHFCSWQNLVPNNKISGGRTRELLAI